MYSIMIIYVAKIKIYMHFPHFILLMCVCLCVSCSCVCLPHFCHLSTVHDMLWNSCHLICNLLCFINHVKSTAIKFTQASNISRWFLLLPAASVSTHKTEGKPFAWIITGLKACLQYCNECNSSRDNKYLVLSYPFWRGYFLLCIIGILFCL